MASPELQVVLKMLRENPPIQGDGILEQRENMASMTRDLPRQEDVTYTPVDAGGVPAEWVVAPESRDDYAVLYFHGGGYVMGSIDSHRGLATRLARAAAARILVVDYRLAPEHPHPAAVDDVLAAWDHARGEGVMPERAGFAGDSAGGGLTAASLVALRDRKDPLPAAAACISPWTDLTCSSESVRSKADTDPIVTVSLLQEAAEAYAAGGDPRHPTASPHFADLSGLPPLLVQVGSEEILLDDARALAERAAAASVDVRIDIAEGLFHVWHAFADILPEGREAIDEVGAFFRTHWD